MQGMCEGLSPGGNKNWFVHAYEVVLTTLRFTRHRDSVPVQAAAKMRHDVLRCAVPCIAWRGTLLEACATGEDDGTNWALAVIHLSAC